MKPIPARHSVLPSPLFVAALLALVILSLPVAPGATWDGQRLGPEEIADLAGDLPARRGERDRFGRRIEQALEREPVSPRGVPAVRVDLAYGKHPRNVLDLWAVEAEPAAPLAVFLHGGGFQRGDKALLRDSRLLDQLLDAGISVAAVNYRFSHQHPEGVAGSLRDIARAVQFLRHQAEELGIDPARFAAFGGSAGGAAALWLAFYEELADAGSDDPVARQSTRMRCVGAMATPSTLDLLQWPGILGIDEQDLERAARSFGIANLAELRTAESASLRAKLDIAAWMSPGDPPFFVRNNDPGGVPRAVDAMAHHPNHARVLLQRAAEVGVEAIVFAPAIGIEPRSGEDLVAFFTRHLFADGNDQATRACGRTNTVANGVATCIRESVRTAAES